MQEYRRTVELPVSIAEAFAYHQRPGALQRLLPPWEDIRILESDPAAASTAVNEGRSNADASSASTGGSPIDVGRRVVLETRTAGVRLKVIARHTRLEPPFLFEDVMDSGPFAHWEHQHRFLSASAAAQGTASSATGSNPDSQQADSSNASPDTSSGRSILSDEIRYQLPFGGIGQMLGSGLVRQKLDAMFAYRHAVTAGDLKAMAKANLGSMTIGVSGASGLFGSQLSSFLGLAGHDVYRLVRGKSKHNKEIHAWGDAGESQQLGALDAVIHLAGESIATSRWSEDVKQRIRSSRVDKTRELCQKLAGLERRPNVLLCASATGIYGDRGDELLDETSQAGDGFLADVAQQWEAACQPAVEAGIRVVHLRFGIILSPRGGALKKMLLPAKLGVSGPLGSGRQWWAWIGIDDAVRAAYHCLGNQDLQGPVNFVAPEPVRCGEFASMLGKVLHRPAFIPAPAFALRLGLGEMADALLLASTRVVPRRLIDSGFEYQFPDLEQTLRHLLGRTH